MIPTVKGFVIVNKIEVDVFLEMSCFFDDPVDVGNLISSSSAFSKSSFNTWKVTVYILLKPGLGSVGALYATGEDQFSFQSQRWAVPKKVQNTTQLHLMSCLQGNVQILQARFQQYVNQELADVQAAFRKGRETRGQIANICWVIEKATEFQKNILFHWLC